MKKYTHGSRVAATVWVKEEDLEAGALEATELDIVRNGG
jgi:hypothetical protein